MKQLLLLLCISFSLTSALAQDKKPPQHIPKIKYAHSFELFQGAYLFVDHIPYNSVLLKGARLNFPIQSLVLGIEYGIGSTTDNSNNAGTVHHFSLRFSHFFWRKNNWSLHGFAGGGFLEFKDFTQDQYGLGWYVGLRTSMRLIQSLYGFIEPRYLNVGAFGFSGQDQFGISWGLGFSF